MPICDGWLSIFIYNSMEYWSIWDAKWHHNHRHNTSGFGVWDSDAMGDGWAVLEPCLAAANKRGIRYCCTVCLHACERVADINSIHIEHGASACAYSKMCCSSGNGYVESVCVFVCVLVFTDRKCHTRWGHARLSTKMFRTECTANRSCRAVADKRNRVKGDIMSIRAGTML